MVNILSPASALGWGAPGRSALRGLNVSDGEGLGLTIELLDGQAWPSVSQSCGCWLVKAT